jgi:hypothetical protein
VARRDKRAVGIDASLVSEGWRTPDTYDSASFGVLPLSAGIYLFLLFDRPSLAGYKPRQPVVGYVGKSTNIARRLVGHGMAHLIRKQRPDLWIQGWFLAMEPHLIDDAEVEAIHRFNPPYNLQHRLRGVAA